MTNTSWKGLTINEIVNARVRNATNPNPNLYRANPLRLYRRTLKGTTQNESNGLMAMDYPSGSQRTVSTDCNGITQIKHFNLTTRQDERPGSCGACSTTAFSKEADARRRVRSSGMNSKKFFSSTKQYLDNRTKSYNRNQYYNIRQGDETSKAGGANTKNNVYSSNGLSHCPKHTFQQDVTFEYQWVDGTYYPVTIPAGAYNDNDVNAIFKNTMISNLHYYIKTEGEIKHLLMNLSYNASNKKFEFTTTAVSDTIFDNINYQVPQDSDGNTTWSTPTTTVVPGIRLSNAIYATAPTFAAAMGFQAAIFPSVAIGGVQDVNTTVFYSTGPVSLQPKYVPLFYKPSNHQYAEQGAVSSSSRILRLKYESITGGASTYMNALGQSVANALAYGVPQGGYTVKDKIGYPLKCTPKNVNGVMQSCPSTKIIG